ncbi:class I SAM-dependent methyltransferase [Nocardiopsis deserti]|uniref:class I SAM-dependent methyltransferase n=1 Tax=Nocardiopsis deserti TaxID=2605988 RepID=UPI0016804AA5|nr:class I SAM-dependent methyltransferase [Nocardiopsis deserti]
MTSSIDTDYGRQFARWYDRLFDPSAAEETAKVLAGCHPAPDTGALELGVGTGRVALPLARMIGAVTGVDSSRDMLAVLAEANARTGGRVTGVHADMRTYQDTRSYALVYAVCATLNQLLRPEDQREAVHRAAGLLAPGGKLFIEAHHRPAVTEALHMGRPHVTFFTPYPEPGTGLQTHSAIAGDGRTWQCSQIWYEKDGTTRVGTEYSRLLVPEEVHTWAEEAGLSLDCPREGYGDWALNTATEQSATFICVYTRPAP